MIEIPLTRNGERVLVKVDDEDADLAKSNWHMAGGKGSKGKYASRTSRGVREYMHRVIATRMGILPLSAYTRGQVPGDPWLQSVDHINGDKLDNRRGNLRMRNRVQQMTNPNDGLRTTNTSGYRGVSYSATRRACNKWRAYKSGRTIGWFATAEDAAAARRAWDDCMQ